MAKTRNQRKKTQKKRNRARRNKRGGGADITISYDTFNVDNSVADINSTEKAPKVSLLPLALSTFIMYDPDSVLPQWVHWLVINIPDGDITKGYVVLSYNKPEPPPNTGTHRYIFNQFEQSTPLSIDRTMPRRRFNIDNFTKKHNLILKATKTFSIITAVE